VAPLILAELLAAGEPSPAAAPELHGATPAPKCSPRSVIERRPRPFPGREGVLFLMRRRAANVFFITLKKSERLVLPPTTRYQANYAISTREFHWESQSPCTREASIHRPAVISITGECGSRVAVVGAGGETGAVRDAAVSVPRLSTYVKPQRRDRRWRIRWRPAAGDSGRPSIRSWRGSVKGFQNFRIFRPLPSPVRMEWKAVGPMD